MCPYKPTILFVALSAAILLPSCSDDATPRDETAPEVILVSSSSAITPTVWNTVRFMATATDDQGIDQIEIKVDGTTVGTSATSPYEFSWDTQKTADGPHTITATATDKAGNQQTSNELRVTVQNILLEAQIDNNMLTQAGSNQTRGFLFLSDIDGKVLAAQEYHNGELLTLRSPGFEGTDFSITEVTIQSAAVVLRTIAHVGRGKWKVLKSNYVEPTPVGTAELTFTNAGDAWDTHYRMSTDFEISMGKVSKDHPQASLKLLKSPSLLYVERTDEDENKTFNVYTGITPGSNTPIDLALVTRAFTAEPVSLPANVRRALVSCYGISDGATYPMFTQGGDADFMMRYPGNAFPAYYSLTQLYPAGSTEDYYYANYANKPYDVVPLAATFSPAFDNNKFTVNATGTLDVYTLAASRGSTGPGDVGQFWSFLAPKTTATISFPQIPTILQDLVKSSFIPTDIFLTASDYEKVEGYSAYIDIIRNGSVNDQLTPVKSLSYFFSPTGSGGRKGAPTLKLEP